MFRYLVLLFLILGLSTPAAVAQAQPQIMGVISAPIDGSISYDVRSKTGNGWYTDSQSGQRYQLGFKQGERASADPIEVATIAIDNTQGYPHPPCFVFTIISRHENNPRSTAYYKVALDNMTKQNVKRLTVDKSKYYDHRFSMKIVQTGFSIQDGAPVVFEEYWQGSPFSAPVALVMINKNDAERQGWSDSGKDGNFILSINNDDHAPLHSFHTKSEIYDLGPIVTDQWMTWQVQVHPDPNGTDGRVDVLLNNKVVKTVTGQKIGFDPSNPQYGAHKPAKVFQSVNVLLYRRNGPSYQQVLFDNMSLTVK